MRDDGPCFIAFLQEWRDVITGRVNGDWHMCYCGAGVYTIDVIIN